jgi:hypothetical protein
MPPTKSSECGRRCQLGGSYEPLPLAAARTPSGGFITQHNFVMKTIATDLLTETASSGHSTDHPPWIRRWLGRVRLPLAEWGSLRPCAWGSGEGSGAVPVLSDRRRWRQLIQAWRDNARAGTFRDPLYREMWSRVAAICDKARNRMRKVSCPAPRFPALPPSLRHTAPKNQSPAGCNDLPSRVCLNWSLWTILASSYVTSFSFFFRCHSCSALRLSAVEIGQHTWLISP